MDENLRNYVITSMELQRKINSMNMYEFAELEWTTEPPTQEGWYWVNFKIFVVDYVLPVQYPLRDTEENMHLATHWLGPIPEPEKPSG
jgi:hypothetical protein